MSSSNEQWMQFYNPISMEEDHETASYSTAFSDATAAVMASARGEAASAAAAASSSPSSSSCSPRGRVSKPVGRRSRASKKTPTTLLNADPNNFRSLVQQFTGCPSGTLCFESKKGPVNLDFGLANDQRYATTKSAAAPNFGSSFYYDNNHHQQQPHHQVQVQVQVQQQQCSVSSDYYVANDAVFSSASNYRNNPNGLFPMDDDDDDMSHELSNNAFFR